MSVTLKQLRYLLALHGTRHFGAAAGHCHVTQSTLSAAIQELETTLDAQLVERTRRRVTFTPMGEEIVERAQRVVAEADDLMQLARRQGAPLSGRLRLGVIPTIAPFYLPRILPHLRARYPSLRLFLREDQTARLLEQLEGGQLDALLLALPYNHAGIQACPLFPDPLRLCRPRQSGQEGASMGALDPRRLLLLEDGHCLRDHVVAACSLAERGPFDGFKATSLHTLVQMVDNGLGETLIPEMAVQAGILEGTGLEAAPFVDGEPKRTIALAWRRGTSRQTEFELLAAVLKDPESGYTVEV
jgi:LysR family transcriptional regulator, hydrogen peroxide-inducible genes activator